jgi:poly(3-hydroxybutyrate) depolymerase
VVLLRTFAIAMLALSAGACGGAESATGPSYPDCTEAAEECLDRLDVGSGLSLPFYRNFSLTTPNPAITQAIIVVHGVDRDANDFYHTVATAAKQAEEEGTTLVLAPHFECPDDSPPSGDVYWQCTGGGDWTHGYADASGAASPVYSYAVVDTFVSDLAKKATFPNLTKVIVTGLSAGGQLTERYAETNEIDPVSGVALEYIVLSPSSYAYLDPDRLADGATCSAEGGCSGAFTPYWDASSCSAYDQYPYGLEGRSGYVAVPSAHDLEAHYVARDVTLTVGSEDTLANAAGTDMDTSCEANAQGIDRVARAVDFWNRVNARFGAHHPLIVVPGCMHSETCMYFSPELRNLLFPAPPTGGP